MTETRLIETPVHGRILVRHGPESHLLVAFHGYAQNAEIEMAELELLDVAGWTRVAVQALHPFYLRQSDQIGATWMTRQDREEAIVDNVEYIRRVLAQFPTPQRLVFTGFSQGVAMAWRAATAFAADGLMVLGGDAPPDIPADIPLPPLLLGRGDDDDWYTAEKLEKDMKFIGGRTSVELCRFPGRHERSEAFRTAQREFLARVASSG